MISRWLVIPPKRYRKKIKSDPQRHLIYSLERETIGQSINTRSSRDHLRSVASHACRKYKVPNVKLMFVHEPDTRLFGWEDHQKITLNSGFHGCNIYTLLHELAHHITDEKYEEGIEHHGPEFFSIYIDLMDRYRVFPRRQMKALADQYGVRY